MTSTSFKTILTQTQDTIAIITLNRPEALNALSAQLMREMGQALTEFDKDDQIRVIIITGSEKAFAAGADIKEMQSKTCETAYREDFITADWTTLERIRKPVIAAVSGYALGGGCELSMMCDIIIASDTAKFSQPEITIGTIPGCGGTQRLTRAIGKSKAMEMCLTGNMITAQEAERIGLISRVVPQAELMNEAIALAQKIASFSLTASMMTKEAVNKAYDSSLTEGLKFERRLFHSTFSLEDQKEGMQAFIEKRKPKFK